ncbi:hypothetical protein F4778DRAFT_783171 [Xylariomycetidae sp. FL2044]|nr:hypothetical protein F4778DRAFT_783171 [Xylariomycetidae sp. FL2044]
MDDHGLTVGFILLAISVAMAYLGIGLAFWTALQATRARNRNDSEVQASVPAGHEYRDEEDTAHAGEGLDDQVPEPINETADDVLGSSPGGLEEGVTDGDISVPMVQHVDDVAGDQATEVGSENRKSNSSSTSSSSTSSTSL